MSLRRLWCIVWGHTWEAPLDPGEARGTPRDPASSWQIRLVWPPPTTGWACACCGRPGRVVWMCDGSRDRDGRWVVQKVVRE